MERKKMSMKKYQLIMIVMVLAMPIISYSADYYIDPSESLNEAVNRLQSGDTLYLRGGVYNKQSLEAVNWVNPLAFVGINQNSNANSEAQRITIAAYPGEKPVISCIKALEGWTRATADDPFLTIAGFVNPNYTNIYWAEFEPDDCSVKEDANGYLSHVWAFEDNELMSLCTDTEQDHVIVHPKTFRTVGGESVGQRSKLFDASHLTQTDDYWKDSTVMVNLGAENTIHIRTIAGSNQAERSITFGSFIGTSSSYPHDIRATDSYTIRNHPHLLIAAGQYYYTPRKDSNGKYRLYVWPKNPGNLSGAIGVAKWTHAFWFQGPGPTNTRSYFTFDGLEIVGGGIGASTSSSGYNHLVFKNCFIHDIPNVGIGPGRSDNSIIKNCRIYRVTSYSTPFVGGRTLGFSGNNIKIHNNDFRYSNRSMFYTTASNNIQVTNNYFLCTGHHAQPISLYADKDGVGCSDVLVAHNIFVTARNPAITTHKLGNSVFFGNLFYKPTSGGAGLQSWSDGVDDHYFLNNTFVAIDSDGNDASHYIVLTTNGKVYAFNNINKGCVIKVTGDGNSYERSNNIHFGRSWDQYKSPYLETELVWDDFNPPLTFNDIFADPHNEDFAPKEDSVIIGAGTNLSDFIKEHGLDTKFPDFDYTKDITGSDWGNAPSIGCMEYGSLLVLPEEGDIWTIPSDPQLPDIPNNPENDTDENANNQNGQIRYQTLLRISNNIIKSGGNAEVTINCDVKDAGKLTVKIYDSKGKEIIVLWDGHKEAGTQPFPWAGVDSGGSKVGSGIYLVHMECGGYKETKKIAVIK